MNSKQASNAFLIVALIAAVLIIALAATSADGRQRDAAPAEYVVVYRCARSNWTVYTGFSSRAAAEQWAAGSLPAQTWTVQSAGVKSEAPACQPKGE